MILGTDVGGPFFTVGDKFWSMSYCFLLQLILKLVVSFTEVRPLIIAGWESIIIMNIGHYVYNYTLLWLRTALCMTASWSNQGASAVAHPFYLQVLVLLLLLLPLFILQTRVNMSHLIEQVLEMAWGQLHQIWNHRRRANPMEVGRRSACCNKLLLLYVCITTK